MKIRHLFYLLASLSMVMSACETDNEISGNDTPPEGYYLFTSYNMYNSYTPSSNIAPQTGENTLKANSHKGIRTRSTMDENGTISFNYSQYGKFTKIGDKQYRLSNGIEIDLRDAAGSNRQVRYKHHDGTVTVVYVSVITPIQGDATASLCRTWN